MNFRGVYTPKYRPLLEEHFETIRSMAAGGATWAEMEQATGITFDVLSRFIKQEGLRKADGRIRSDGRRARNSGLAYRREMSAQQHAALRAPTLRGELEEAKQFLRRFHAAVYSAKVVGRRGDRVYVAGLGWITPEDLIVEARRKGFGES